MLYEEIINEGDLVFDVGSNIGFKTDLFLSMGARVICIEPQPTCVELLINKYKGNKNVSIVGKALSSYKGVSNLKLPQASTLGTLSDKFIENTSKLRFKECLWNTQIAVEVTMLDEIIAIYGIPSFCKIDVEGSEIDVLKGLSISIPCISIEFVPELFDNAESCIDRLLSIDSAYKFNYSPEETNEFCFKEWVNKEILLSYLRTITDYRVSFGDIYVNL